MKKTEGQYEIKTRSKIFQYNVKIMLIFKDIFKWTMLRLVFLFINSCSNYRNILNLGQKYPPADLQSTYS